jgi:long-chain fatty acid transport protein
LSKSSRIQTCILLGGMAAILLCTSQLALAGGFFMSAVGDRARGMGGAFTGLADDWSAVFYNPAGGAFIPASEMFLSGAVVSPRIEYTPDTLVLNGWRANNRAYGTYYNVDKTMVMPQFGGYAKLSESAGLSLGLGFYTQAMNNMVWNLFQPYYRTGAEFPQDDTRSDLRMWTGQPTLGYRINNRVSLGVGLIVTRAVMKSQRVHIVDDPGAEFNLPPYPVGKAMIDQSVDGSGWGVGYNLGTMVKLDGWQVGATFQSKVTHQLDGESITNFWSQQVDGRGELTDPLIEQDLLSGKKHTAIQDVDFEVTLPPFVSLGFAFFPSSNLRFTTDLTHTWYSEVPGMVVTKNDDVTFKFGDPNFISTEVTVPTTQVFHWQDQWRIAAGMEWDASSAWQIRAGAYYEGAVIESAGLTPLYWDVGTKISPSAGASVNFGPWRLGASYGIVFHGDQSTTTPTDDNLPGLYGGLRHETHVAFGYGF